jgi:hypothetical protein
MLIYMEILSPAFSRHIYLSYFGTCRKPAILAFEGHAFRASGPPQMTSILPPFHLPTLNRLGPAVPLLRLLFELDAYGLRRGLALGARRGLVIRIRFVQHEGI